MTTPFAHVYANLDFFWLTSSAVGGGDFGAMV
jgi:hypothetical protein